MNKTLIGFMAILITLFVFANHAQAELIGGKVTSVDTTDNVVKISYVSDDDSKEEIAIKVVDETTLSGVESFASIKIGDEIWAEANQDPKADKWVATSIQRITEVSPQ